MDGGVVGHNFERDQLKYHPCQVCLRRCRGDDLNVKVRRTSEGRTDDKLQVMTKSSHGLWRGELKAIYQLTV